MRDKFTNEFNDFANDTDSPARKRGGRHSGPFSKSEAGRDRRSERRRVRQGKSGV